MMELLSLTSMKRERPVPPPVRGNGRANVKKGFPEVFPKRMAEGDSPRISLCEKGEKKRLKLSPA